MLQLQCCHSMQCFNRLLPHYPPEKNHQSNLKLHLTETDIQVHEDDDGTPHATVKIQILQTTVNQDNTPTLSILLSDAVASSATLLSSQSPAFGFYAIVLQNKNSVFVLGPAVTMPSNTGCHIELQKSTSNVWQFTTEKQ